MHALVEDKDFADFLRPMFSMSHVQHISDVCSEFTLRPHRVWKNGDIESAVAEIRRGKKE